LKDLGFTASTGGMKASYKHYKCSNWMRESIGDQKKTPIQEAYRPISSSQEKKNRGGEGGKIRRKRGSGIGAACFMRWSLGEGERVQGGGRKDFSTGPSYSRSLELRMLTTRDLPHSRKGGKEFNGALMRNLSLNGATTKDRDATEGKRDIWGRTEGNLLVWQFHVYRKTEGKRRKGKEKE